MRAKGNSGIGAQIMTDSFALLSRHAVLKLKSIPICVLYEETLEIIMLLGQIGERVELDSKKIEDTSVSRIPLHPGEHHRTTFVWKIVQLPSEF